MGKRGRPLIRENEGVSSPKRRKTGVLQRFCGNMSHFCQAHFVALDFKAFFALRGGYCVRYMGAMTLPTDYLDYPHRRHGQDIDRYEWRQSVVRPKMQWPERKSVAVLIVVPLEFFMLNPSGQPFKHPGAMVTPYPDLRHYTTRDYGNRVGVYRLLKVLKASGLKATFPVNAALLDVKQSLIDIIIANGHEIAAHGWDTDSIHWGGMCETTEADYVARTRDAFSKLGYSPTTWMSPARQQSFVTPDLIKSAGFDTCLDWESDAVPWEMGTKHGPLTCVPLSNELDDRKLLIEQRHTEADWRDQILAARDLLAEEAPRFGGQVLSFTLTPYISGLPFRIWAVREALGALAQDDNVWSATAREIALASKDAR